MEIRRVCSVALAGASLVALWSCIGGGGCPWLHSSVTVAPATPCLTVTNANPTGDGPGGCVNPSMMITNGCTDTLVIASATTVYAGADGGAAKDDAGALDIPPGTAAGVEIDTIDSVGTHTVNATLGTQSLTFTITTTR